LFLHVHRTPEEITFVANHLQEMPLPQSLTAALGFPYTSWKQWVEQNNSSVYSFLKLQLCTPVAGEIPLYTQVCFTALHALVLGFTLVYARKSPCDEDNQSIHSV